MIFAAQCRFAISLYRDGPAFVCFYLMICCSAAAVLVFLLHTVCHCFLDASLMCLACADFSGLYCNCVVGLMRDLSPPSCFCVSTLVSLNVGVARYPHYFDLYVFVFVSDSVESDFLDYCLT